MWELISYIQAKDRKSCLMELSDGPKTPSMIADSSNKHLSHISRALRELSEKELVICLTPDASKNRFYKITDLGEKVLRKDKKLK